MTEAEILALPYRPCVGVVLVNRAGKVFAGQRIDSETAAWQMPQGGVDAGEDEVAAALRELREETGVPAEAVAVEAAMQERLAYDLPLDLVPKLWKGRYRGQEQRWFLLRFLGEDRLIDIATEHPEFRAWRWARPAEILDLIVPFKRQTYAAVFEAFRDRLA